MKRPIQIPMSHKISLVVFCAFFLTLITLSATSSEFHSRESTKIKLNDEKAKERQDEQEQQQQQQQQPSVAAVVDSQGQTLKKSPSPQQQQQVQQQLSSPVLPLVVTGQLTSSSTMDIIKSTITSNDGNKSKSVTARGENELSPVKRMDNLMEEDFPLTALHSFYHRKVPTGPLTPPQPPSPLPSQPPPLYHHHQQQQQEQPPSSPQSGSRSTLSSTPFKLPSPSSSPFKLSPSVNSLNSVPSVASSSPSLLLFNPSINGGLDSGMNNGMSSGSTVDVTKYTHPQGHFTLSDHRSEKYHRFHHSGHLNNDQVKGDTLDQIASSSPPNSGVGGSNGGLSLGAATTMALDHQHQSQPLAITDYNELKGKHGYFPPSMYKDFIDSAHQRTLNTLYGHIDDKGFFVPASNVPSHLTPSAKSTMTTITTPGIQSLPFDPSYLPPLQGGSRGASPSPPSPSSSPSSPLSSLSASFYTPSSPSTPSSSTIQVTSNNSPSSKGQIRSVLIGETLASALNREQKQHQQQLQLLQQQQQQSQQQPQQQVQQGQQEASSSSANERIGYFGPHPMMFGGYLPPYHQHHSLPHYPVYPFMSPIHSLFHNTLPHHQLEQLTMPYMSPPYMMPPAYFGPVSPFYGPYHRSLTESPTSHSSSPSTVASSGSHSSHQIPVGSSSLMHLPGGVYSASASSKSPSIHPHASYTGPMAVANSSPANFTLNSSSSSSTSTSTTSLLLPPVESTSPGGTSIMSPIHHFNLNDKEHKLQFQNNSNTDSIQSLYSLPKSHSSPSKSLQSSSPTSSSSSATFHGTNAPISTKQARSQKKFFFPGPSNQL